jgi:hypothetical protein
MSGPQMRRQLDRRRRWHIPGEPAERGRFWRGCPWLLPLVDIFLPSSYLSFLIIYEIFYNHF